MKRSLALIMALLMLFLLGACKKDAEGSIPSHEDKTLAKFQNFFMENGFSPRLTKTEFAGDWLDSFKIDGEPIRNNAEVAEYYDGASIEGEIVRGRYLCNTTVYKYSKADKAKGNSDCGGAHISFSKIPDGINLPFGITEKTTIQDLPQIFGISPDFLDKGRKDPRETISIAADETARAEIVHDPYANTTTVAFYENHEAHYYEGDEYFIRKETLQLKIDFRAGEFSSFNVDAITDELTQYMFDEAKNLVPLVHVS